MKRGLEIFGVVLTMFGSVALLACLLFGLFTYIFVAGATHTIGSVTAFTNQAGLNYPVVTFQSNDSNINITMPYSNTSQLYYVGDKVPILYSPDNPPGGKVDSFIGLWFLPTFLLITAVVLLAIGLALAFAPGWRERRKKPKYS